MEPVKVLLLGAGSRGTHVYAEYAKMNPGMMKIAAVAEPSEARRNVIQEEHGLEPGRVFTGWKDAMNALPAETEAVIIATQDKMHAEALAEAMKRNLHILCEKPIVPTLRECRDIERKSADFDKVFMVAHVLKYTPFFSKIKELLDGGRIGTLVGIDLAENVGHIHMSHSFVRGNWRSAAESSPMILAKSCHDMDMLRWLAGSPCESLSSYGALRYFKKENAPEGAPERCLDGCPRQTDCPYHVSKIYLGDYTGWPVNVISADLSINGRFKALRTGPYGRCVFRCDNDVVDHQTVSLRFANGVMATFTMSAFTMRITRTVTLFGTGGEITGDLEDGRVTLKCFASGNTEEISVAVPTGGHSGGDVNFITDFVKMIRGGGAGRNVAKRSFESHYMAFAAEHSRLNGSQTIDPRAFKDA
ncbi:MAG: Gfo/Idh/MocA family oxidoreductase [Treponema sp.]|jgi:predicted dehydrogenase|nr:Gfo/Idh/MocA family oxidoreductase [Treponema sp.]